MWREFIKIFVSSNFYLKTSIEGLRSVILISGSFLDTFTFVGYNQYKVSVIEAIMLPMLSKVF